MKYLPILAATLCLLLLVPAVEAAPIILGETETIDSRILGEERTLMVSLPPGYEGGETTYPVVYLLDARTRFLHTVGTLEALARIGHIPQMITVGITNTDRTRDLTPPWTHENPPEDRTQVIEAGGGADNFLRFLRDELIPHVEGSYRTAPYRILVGHSFGGLFAVHALVTEPGLFNATLAISPSLWWDEGRTVKQAQTLFEAQPELRAQLYLTLAGEGGEMLAEFQNMETLLRYRAPGGLRWQAHVLDGEDHGSIPIPSVHAGLRAFFPRWQVPPFARQGGLEAIDRHYASLTGDYGYAIQTPEALINNLGYQALGSQEMDRAVEIFRTNVERYPASANVYDSLGEALEAAGELKEARKLYSKACDLGQGANDPNLSAYTQHRDAVAAKLSEAH